MSLRNKLRLILLLLALCSAGLAAVTAWATAQWRETDRQIQEHYLRSLALQKVRAQTFRAFKELPDALTGGDPNAKAEFDHALRDVDAQFAVWLAAAETEEERAQHAGVYAAFREMVRESQRCFDLLAIGQRGAAQQVMENDLEARAFVEFDRVTENAWQSDALFRKSLTAQARLVRAEAQWAVFSAALGSLVVLALGIALVASDIFRPLREIERALQEIGHGNFTSRVIARDERRGAASRDELGVLVRTFNNVVDELSRTTVSKAYLDSIIESMADALLVAAADGTIRTANPAAAALFGTNREEMIGKSLAEFLPSGADLSGHERIRDLETTIRPRSGREITVSLSRSVMRAEDGHVLGLVWVAQDISERKWAEQQIRTALEEKEVLFKEINHRVKNNLQVISSLLNLQARQLADPAGLDVLKESHNRIQAMALIHEMLYRSETLAWIDFGDYVRSLTEHLMNSYGASAREIRLAAEMAPVSLSLDMAIPCGLIVNELVTNSLKHAFSADGAGKIVVELRELPNRNYCLAVRDNGVGLPVDLHIEETRSLGLRLVRTLTEQLGGKLAYVSDNGAKFEITFPTQHKA